MKFALKSDDNKDYKQLIKGDTGYCIKYVLYGYIDVQYIFVYANTENEALNKFIQNKDKNKLISYEILDKRGFIADDDDENTRTNFNKLVKKIQIWDYII